MFDWKKLLMILLVFGIIWSVISVVSFGYIIVILALIGFACDSTPEFVTITTGGLIASILYLTVFPNDIFMLIILGVLFIVELYWTPGKFGI